MLRLPDALTQTTAAACLRELGAGLQSEHAAVVVDASGLSRFDSTALAVLLSLRRDALRVGKTFAIAGLPQRLGDLARLYGIAELLPAQA
jgi:phospholipid transport system transporter-binding protein